MKDTDPLDELDPGVRAGSQARADIHTAPDHKSKLKLAKAEKKAAWAAMKAEADRLGLPSWKKLPRTGPFRARAQQAYKTLKSLQRRAAAPAAAHGTLNVGGRPRVPEQPLMERSTKITKNMLKRLVEQELQETGFQMAPGSDESGPEGEPITGQLYDYGVEDTGEPGAEEEEEMDFGGDGDTLAVEPKLNLYSMGRPGSEGGPPVASFEGRVSKQTLQQMILEEMQIMQEGAAEYEMAGKIVAYAPAGHAASWGPDKHGPNRTAQYILQLPKELIGKVSSGKAIHIDQALRLHPKMCELNNTIWFYCKKKKGGLSTGAKVGLGVAGAAALGGIGYGLWKGSQHSRDNAPDPTAPGARTSETALDLYLSMKGMGTDEDYIKKAIQANANPRKMRSLNRAFDAILRQKDDTDDGSLADWLEDDGMDSEAETVKQLLSQPVSRGPRSRGPRSREVSWRPKGFDRAGRPMGYDRVGGDPVQLDRGGNPILIKE